MKDYNMIGEFIGKAMKSATYELKKDTAMSYYRTAGCDILPRRLSISKNKEVTDVKRKGRNAIHPIVGQLLGEFTKKEQSPLKQHYPFRFRTQIWKVPLYPSFIGYGTIGITNEEGKIADTGDLVVLDTTDNWETISIFYFVGMGNPNDMEQVMKHLQEKKGIASQQHPSNGL